MNEDLIKNLESLLVKAEQEHNFWKQKFEASRKSNQWGNGEYYTKADKHYQLTIDLKKIINKLMAKTTFFEREATLNSYCYVDQCKAKGLI